MNKTSILLTGATGYVGGSVLNELLTHPIFSQVDIVALVRSPEKAEKLKELGVQPVLGSHTDYTLVKKLAEEADLVIAVADADAIGTVKALLSGLKTRFEKTGTPPIFIETSGAGIFMDDANGDFKSDIVYDDTNPDQIETLAPTQHHRNVDLEVVRADSEGYIRGYIIVPGTVWGFAEGVLVDRGIQNRVSQQVPILISMGLDRGKGGMIGEGKNIWTNVHIKDLADLYILLIERLLQSPETMPHGREGFYFAENGEHTLYEVAKKIGEALVAVGRASESEPTSFSEKEVEKYFSSGAMTIYFGSNSRCRSNRARGLGWKPIKTKADFLTSIYPEMQALLKKQKSAL